MKQQDQNASDTPQAAPSRAELEQHLRARAWKDDAFRQEFLADPKAVLERDYATWSQEGKISSELTIKVVEEDEQTLCFVLPPRVSEALLEMEDLDEKELSSVAGGGELGTKKCSKRSSCKACGGSNLLDDISKIRLRL